MAQKRKASARTPKAKPPPKPRGAPRAETVETAPPLPSIAEERRASPIKLETAGTEPLGAQLGVPGVETSQQAIVCIAQDAVLILRHELAFRAVQSIETPGQVSMGDCIALLRLTTELGAAAARGAEEIGQKANYDRLSPVERVQLASLLLKVDYLDAP